jgi:hypothetical protein
MIHPSFEIAPVPAENKNKNKASPSEKAGSHNYSDAPPSPHFLLAHSSTPPPFSFPLFFYVCWWRFPPSSSALLLLLLFPCIGIVEVGAHWDIGLGRQWAI